MGSGTGSETSRLLNLYPVDVLRERWMEDAKSQKKAVTIQDIVGNVPPEKILEFCYDHHAITKQHICLFEVPRRGPQKGPAEPLLSGYTPKIRHGDTGGVEEFYLLGVTYKVLVGPDYYDTELTFPWPLRVTLFDGKLELAFTILEKNIAAHLPPGETLIRATRDLDEATVLAALNPTMLGGTPRQLDLNVGIKSLWEHDKIDAIHSKWKSPRATLTEVMDERFLLKRDHPAQYQEAIKSPLLKMVFKVLDLGDNVPDIFAIDPSAGQLMFNRFSKDAAEVQNVLRAILAAN